ncbi:MAG TPA: hypothetical protein VH475_00080 [Tepidisphaeraceae bacterium]
MSIEADCGKRTGENEALFREVTGRLKELAGAGSPSVARRLEAALIDVRSLVLPERRPILDRRLEALAVGVSRASTGRRIAPQ